jgi:aerobic-type carbon monoxide dehydrogenase small subunit (CoxS/CutS family)
MSSLRLLINGSERHVEAPADESLLSVLRDRLQLTGTKYGCGEGQCGACTVLLDGRPVRSCRTSVGAVPGKKITTIEGLARDGKLHPVQEAFLKEQAFQCAYCTSGMIMSSVALLGTNSNPSERDIVSFMNGNICRCGTYPRIVCAIQRAAQSMRKG